MAAIGAVRGVETATPNLRRPHAPLAIRRNRASPRRRDRRSAASKAHLFPPLPHQPKDQPWKDPDPDQEDNGAATMTSIDDLLQQLRTAPVESVSCKRIKTDAALQPRDPQIAGYADRERLEATSETHVDAMHSRLVGDACSELTPVLIGNNSGTLLLVDGHHRLKATLRSGRTQIPARVLPMTMTEAVHVSKLVNLGQAALALHPEQAREALWQHMAMLTSRGKTDLPEHVTYRGLAGRFGNGVSAATVSRMLKRMSEVKASDYSFAALDPVSATAPMAPFQDRHKGATSRSP